MSSDGLSKRESAFFNIAKEVSMLSNHKTKLGCVIIDKHRIISSGHNSQTKCHRLQADIDKKYFKLDNCKGPVHAEVAALLPLIKRKQDLSTATVYLYRESNDTNMIAMSRPCPRCMSLIKQCGIKKIKYTTPDGYATEKII